MTDEENKEKPPIGAVTISEEQQKAMSAVATAYADVAEQIGGQRPVFLVIVSLSTGGKPGDGRAALSMWPVPAADEKMLEKAREVALEVAHDVVCTAGQLERVLNDALVRVVEKAEKVCKKEDLN